MAQTNQKHCLFLKLAMLESWASNAQLISFPDSEVLRLRNSVLGSIKIEKSDDGNINFHTTLQSI